ncbi:MAG: IS1595 family transposase, partial [Candidatus Saccharimonadales bacterium]
MENKYFNRSHISEAKSRQLVRLFCEDMTATQIASLASLNRNTVNRLLTHIRQSIVAYCEA